MPSLAESTLSSLISHPLLTALLLLTPYLLYSFGNSYFHLRHIPGPWVSTFTDLYLIYRTWRGSTFRDLNTLYNQYGPIFRIAPNFVVVADPAEVRKIWGVRSQFDRAKWYKGFRLDPPHDTLISMCDGDGREHVERRGKMAAGVSFAFPSLAVLGMLIKAVRWTRGRGSASGNR
jgi:hypothetical protein